MRETQIVYLVSILAFVGVVALVEAVYLLWQGATPVGDPQVARRLRNLSAGGEHGRKVADLLKRRQLTTWPALDRVLSGIPRLHALDRLIEQAGAELTVARFIAGQILMTAAAWLALAWPGGMTASVAFLPALAAGAGLPLLYLWRRAQRQRARLIAQLPDALDFIARALRAGNPFSAALKAAAAELPAPVGSEFGITFDELNYGLEIDDALYNMSERSGREEMHYFVAAVLIQKTTGGNLADLLNRIAGVLRARARTLTEIQVQASEMRLTARILIALPFVVAAVITVVNPGYLPELTGSPVGRILIGVQLLMMLIGYLVIRRMINFRV